MTPPTCGKCNDTGYLYRRFYTAARHCTCPLGAERASWDTLTVEARNQRAADEATARRETAAALRRARRAAR